ncbi:MAG: hypothetical protein K2X82_04650 [Gemmataceae bacterium]|nr:hypothetical protein [Gemmataceae bacterium]
MTAEHHEFRLPDESVLRDHAHCIGSIGSGKRSTLLDAHGLCYGYGCGPGDCQSLIPDVLAAYHAKFRDIRSFGDPARPTEEPGRTATGTDGSGNTEPTR